jgi:hypothetical protein
MNTTRILWLIALVGLGTLYVIGFGVAVLLNRLTRLRVRRRAMAPALRHLMIVHHPDTRQRPVAGRIPDRRSWQ